MGVTVQSGPTVSLCFDSLKGLYASSELQRRFHGFAIGLFSSLLRVSDFALRLGKTCFRSPGQFLARLDCPRRTVIRSRENVIACFIAGRRSEQHRNNGADT